jgi:hypothetical protein
VRYETCNILVKVALSGRAGARRSDVERGPQDRRDGSRSRNESTRRGSVGVCGFVGPASGRTIRMVLANLYLGIGVRAAIGAFVGFSIEARDGGRDER